MNGIEISSQDVVDELESIRANEAFLALSEEQMAAQGEAVLGEEDDTFNSAFVAQTLSTRILYTIVEAAVADGGYEVDEAYRYYGYPVCYAPEAGEAVVAAAIEALDAVVEQTRTRDEGCWDGA